MSEKGENIFTIIVTIVMFGLIIGGFVSQLPKGNASEQAENQKDLCWAVDCETEVPDDRLYCEAHTCSWEEGCTGFSSDGTYCYKHNKIYRQQEEEERKKQEEERAKQEREALREWKMENRICLVDGCMRPRSEGLACRAHICELKSCGSRVKEGSKYCPKHDEIIYSHSGPANVYRPDSSYDKSEYSDFEDFYEDNMDEFDSCCLAN